MKYLSLDLRALALMRICIAGVVLFDLCVRCTDLEAFYSDTGVAPLQMIFQYAWNRYFISIHTISGLWQVQLFLFACNFFCALMLLIGYRTRLFTLLTWFMMLSLHNRNVLILQAGDDLLRMVLFWGIFLPWGKRYSCDTLAETSDVMESNILSVASVAYLLQVCYIYTGSALLKGAEWDTDFTAVYYAYSLDQIAYPITRYIYHEPGLLKGLTMAAYYFELLVPVLFFIPVKHEMLRILGISAIIIFHFINLCTLFIGFFPLIGITTALGILPAYAMDRFDRFTRSLKANISIAFLSLFILVQHVVKWKRPSYQVSDLQKNIQTAFLIFITVFVFDWNFSNLSFIQSKLSDQLRFIGYGLRLDQSWGMFAPGVFKEDGWYVLEGVTKTGKHIDLLHPGQKLTYDKPESVVSMFKNDRWRKYSENFMFVSNGYMRGYFCNYYQRKWNGAHSEEPIVSMQVIYMKEVTLADYKKQVPEKNILWECN